MLKLIKKLYPLNRSLMGPSNLQTLNILKKYNRNLKIKYFKTGEKFFDWKIPREWRIKEAYITTPDNKKICDFKNNNLHVVGYSKKITKILSLKELQKKLFSIIKNPDAVPYITSYYKKDWGFCIKHKDRRKLKNGNYRVLIDSKFIKGKMHYGEIFIKGELKKEILFSTYICHPSMANNELSGPVLATWIAQFLKSKRRRYSYRIVFTSETIGTIAFIKKNLSNLNKNLLAGYILTCVGDERCFSFIPSRTGNTTSDRFALKILDKVKKKVNYYSWLDRASDERQYCSPGIDLPICTIMKSKYGKFKEYHTSLDTIGRVVTKKGLYESLNVYKKLIAEYEKNFFPITNFKCEPFMTKHKLYPTTNNRTNWVTPAELQTRNIMNFLSWCDGKSSLEEIAVKIKLSSKNINKIFKLLLKKKLIHI
jgi:aminopeptidase-like protein